MCGRIATEADETIIIERFNASSWTPFFEWNKIERKSDLSPGMEIPVIEKPITGFTRYNCFRTRPWGAWFYKTGAKGKPVKQGIINSRSDTILEKLDNPKKTYQKCLKSERIIIPVSAFYEWTTINGNKTKIKIGMPGEVVFALGGYLHFQRLDNGLIEQRAIIITTEPTDQIAQFHDRMPLILHPKDEQSWIAGDEGGREYLQRIFDSNNHTLEILT